MKKQNKLLNRKPLSQLQRCLKISQLQCLNLFKNRSQRLLKNLNCKIKIMLLKRKRKIHVVNDFTIVMFPMFTIFFHFVIFNFSDEFKFIQKLNKSLERSTKENNIFIIADDPLSFSVLCLFH